MILCLDIGNSQIYCGVVDHGKIRLRFRHPSKQEVTSDQLGVFLKSVLRENDIAHSMITNIAICSVVPPLDYSLRSACKKYFDIDPFFLQADADHGLRIAYHNPQEVGADRIANALAAINKYPDENIIIIDFGTATTFCAISADKTYLGGVILPGLHICMEALHSRAAKLSPVEIVVPKQTTGLSTTESIQSGLFYSQLAAVREITQRLIKENFEDNSATIIATGGFAHLFRQEKVFTTILSDLVFDGLLLALEQH